MLNKWHVVSVLIMTSSLCAMDRASSSNSMDVEMATLPSSSMVLSEKDALVKRLKTKIGKSDDHEFGTLLSCVPPEERVQFCKDSLEHSQLVVVRKRQHFDTKYCCGNRKTIPIIAGAMLGGGAINLICIGLALSGYGRANEGVAGVLGVLGFIIAAAATYKTPIKEQKIIDSQNHIQQCLQKYIPQEVANTNEQDQMVNLNFDSNESV